MKTAFPPVVAAWCALAAAVGLVADASRAADIDWRPLMTVAGRKRDADGSLLPLQSYDETIRRGMSLLLDDHVSWFKGPPNSIVDEQGVTQMPWVYYSNLQHDGAPFTDSADRFVSYPAFHHALLIRTFIRYWKYAGDKRAVEEAVKLADWDIAHSTPADWPYARFPWSTFEAKKPGGFRDASGLMPDKAAIMALAYLDLHDATGEKRFRDAAEAIAATLAARQRPDGTWPFRVDPQTQRVIEEYTSSVIYPVMLFEKLDALSGKETYRAARDKTWHWLVNGPIKTKDFRGFYEDIVASPQGRTNYDCLDTIRYLIAHRTADNGYLAMAEDLEAWIEKIFLDKIPAFEPAEGIREQLQCNVVMGIHSLNWASMLLDLAKATGNETLRRRAIQTANYVTYYLQPDNRIVVGFQYRQWWYSCHAGVILYLLDFADAPGAAGRESPAAGADRRTDPMHPIHPGIPGRAPFWNAPAHQFVAAPAFDFKPVSAAACYRFTLAASGTTALFEAAEPWAALTPVWANVPVGPVTLMVEGLDKPGGAVVGLAGKRTFHRGAAYAGPYRPRKSAAEYRQSALLALRTMFDRQYFKDWMQPGVAPADFRKRAAQGTQLQAYAYPSKLIGQIIAGSALYARSTPRPADADEILKIGAKAGELLASLHVPAGKAMEHFPPTYAAGARDAPVSHVMMHYPAEAAQAYLDFHEATNEPRYRDAAVAIATTYGKLQLPSGTWYQVAESERGAACYETLLVPITVVLFLDRLIERYGRTEFHDAREAAWRWIRDNPLQTYNWQSQFEDGKPNPPYGSLSPQQACECARYLFARAADDAENLKSALELLRFAEDQFVVWERPPARPQTGLLAPLSSDKWITPCVCEQHQYWVPVNYSFATLIRTYLAAFRATGDDLHLDKAADLANTLVDVQGLHKGEYPTYPVQPTADGTFEVVQNVWFNCTVGTARAVLELADTLDRSTKGNRE